MIIIIFIFIFIGIDLIVLGWSRRIVCCSIYIRISFLRVSCFIVGIGGVIILLLYFVLVRIAIN